MDTNMAASPSGIITSPAARAEASFESSRTNNAMGDRQWGGNRLRVARACDRCKQRKVRCSGTQDCDGCIRVNAHCVYNAQYNRGKHPRIPPHPHLPRRTSVNISASQTSPTASVQANHTTHAQNEPSRQTEEAAADPPSRASPEPSQTDLQGHYVGPASGVSFLLRVQNRLHHTSSSFTFGDAPLPEFDPTSCVMISKEETKLLVKHYFEFTVPVDRFLHRPTVESWLEEFNETMGAMHPSETAPARRAVLWTMFAMAHDTLKPVPGITMTKKSERFFLSAEYQMSRDRGAVSLASVQARLCQCLWLLSQSRVNHCWTLFGIAARLALAIGLNRNRKNDMVTGFTPIEAECRRRTFWNAYCLDNYLSVALGRPRIFHDDDIDQELPSSVDDNDIHASGSLQRPSHGLSLMCAPVAYFKLSRIISMILKDIYSIRPSSSTDRCAHTAKNFSGSEKLAGGHLSSTGHRTPEHVDVDPHLSSSASRDNEYKRQIEESTKECLQAAMGIVNTVNGLIQESMMFQAFWFTSYFAFSAVVVLYVYVIQHASSPDNAYQEYLSSAIRCQSQIFNIAEENSLAARYCLVLEELKTEAMKQVEISRNPPFRGFENGLDGLEYQGNNILNSTSNTQNLNGGVQPAIYSGTEVVDFNNSPGSSLNDFASWLQFESMAVPGFGSYRGGYEMPFVTYGA